MNRLYLILLIVSLMSLGVNAQKKNYETLNGDLAFEKYKYEEAVVFYKSALKDNPNDNELKLKIAESYRKSNNHKSAVEWYSQVLDTNASDYDDIYKLHYAQALLYSDDKEKAKKWFLSYKEKDTSSRVSENRLEGIENFDNLLKSSKYYSIKSVNLNSPSKDFSPSFFQNGLIFVSDRTTDEGKNKWDSRVFLNLFHSKLSENGTFYPPQELSGKLNTMFHEGPVAIYDNETKIVFTRNNYHKRVLKRSEEGINNLQLFFADINEKGKWSNLRKFEHNSSEFSTGHPTINSTGDLIVFSSDKPGGQGGSDIYYSQLVNEKWSEPKNIGPQVNTLGDELFPFLFQDSILYFSSNGHYGLGGLDVYKASFNKEASSEIENLGVPINSNADDFGVIVHKNGNMGYFSSNRESYENDDIYQFRVIPVGARISVVDKTTKKNIQTASLSITEKGTSKQLEYNGIPLTYKALYDEAYTIEVMAEGYEPEKIKFSTVGIEPGMLKEVAVLMSPIIKSKPEAEPITIPNEVAEVVEIGGTTYIGVKGKLFSPEEMNISKDSLIVMKKNQVDGLDSIEIENIYYEHDKFDLKNQAKRTIHGIVLLMEKYKEAVLEIASHTDSKGSKAYNERLAQDRSNRVVTYLGSLGVDKTRLIATSYGETRLLNNCADGVPCTPQEHRMNRRTEFVLKF